MHDRVGDTIIGGKLGVIHKDGKCKCNIRMEIVRILLKTYFKLLSSVPQVGC